MSKFSEMISLLINENDISKKDLANMLNVTIRTIYSWQRGERECDFDNLIRLSEIFEVTVGELLGTEDY